MTCSQILAESSHGFVPVGFVPANNSRPVKHVTCHSTTLTFEANTNTSNSNLYTKSSSYKHTPTHWCSGQDLTWSLGAVYKPYVLPAQQHANRSYQSSR